MEFIRYIHITNNVICTYTGPFLALFPLIPLPPSTHLQGKGEKGKYVLVGYRLLTLSHYCVLDAPSSDALQCKQTSDWEWRRRRVWGAQRLQIYLM